MKVLVMGLSGSGKTFPRASRDRPSASEPQVASAGYAKRKQFGEDPA